MVHSTERSHKMAVTPKKLVHWDINQASLSELGSPFFNGSMESVISESTSSMEYINSQLVAHGFISSPGLGLEGISNKDLDRAVKCLLGMLSQRMVSHVPQGYVMVQCQLQEDMSRTEELTTKLRTLSYDHERLISMYRTAMERAANAEREMNVHKSRLTFVSSFIGCFLTLTRRLRKSSNTHIANHGSDT